ncbi:MAG: hypothetical protein ACTS3T_02560 [Almyronema sp.]
MTVMMTPEHWQAAKAIAQDLSAMRIDVNELKKVVAYLCWLRHRGNGVNKEGLFHYLSTLAKQGEVRSNQTPRYYQAINQACVSHLRSLDLEGDALIQVLGWAGRLHH